MKPYPIFLTGLSQRRCVVIGGGHEAEHKVKSLLECEAAITLIGQTVSEALRAWAAEGKITWITRDYEPGDLQGAFLVIAEKGEAKENGRIFHEAQAVGALVNVMDDIPHCNFIAGSIVRQGDLTIAISTNGRAPALAVRLRERFEREFGPEYGLFLEWMRDIRSTLAARYPRFAERRARWYQLVDSNILELLKNGRTAEAQAQMVEIVGEGL